MACPDRVPRVLATSLPLRKFEVRRHAQPPAAPRQGAQSTRPCRVPRPEHAATLKPQMARRRTRTREAACRRPTCRVRSSRQMLPARVARLHRRPGQTVLVVDVDGQQVADFVCFRRPTRARSCRCTTRPSSGTIHISTGHLLLSNRCGTLMTITADACSATTSCAGSCSEGTNRWRYDVADTPTAAPTSRRRSGVSRSRSRRSPTSFNIFMNVPIGDGKIGSRSPSPRPATTSTSVRRRSPHRDLECPQKRNPCNAYTPTRCASSSSGRLSREARRDGRRRRSPRELVAPAVCSSRPLRTSTPRAEPPRLRRPPRASPTSSSWAAARPT